VGGIFESPGRQVGQRQALWQVRLRQQKRERDEDLRPYCEPPLLTTLARLKTAETLLRYSNLSVLEVATRSGFGDLSNFHSSFRRHFGLPPHQYRRRAEKATRGIPV